MAFSDFYSTWTRFVIINTHQGGIKSKTSRRKLQITYLTVLRKWISNGLVNLLVTYGLFLIYTVCLIVMSWQKKKKERNKSKNWQLKKKKKVADILCSLLPFLLISCMWIWSTNHFHLSISIILDTYQLWATMATLD